MKRLTKGVCLLICMMLVLAGCSSGSSTAVSSSAQSSQTASAETTKAVPVEKDELKVAIRAEPSTLDPHNSTALANFAVQRVVYDTLVVQDENGNIVPGLAQSWEVLDELTIRFHLRQGVVFSDGSKLTADDVLYSLQRATTEKGSASMFSSFDAQNSAVVDPYTIDIKVKTPFAAIYNYLASSRGDIICKSAMEKLGATEYGRNPVGTGPFILAEVEYGRQSGPGAQ